MNASPGLAQTPTREPAAEAVPQRPRRKGIWMTVAALTAFVAVVPVGVQIWGRLIRHTQHSRIMSGPHPITALEVEMGAGEVEVTAGPAGQVTVDQTLKWALNKSHVERSWDGTTLHLKAVCGPGSVLFSSLECGVGLRIQVPAEVALQAKTSSGTVAAEGLTGTVRLQTSSGVVSMERLAGPVWARASSGVINGTDLGSSRVDVGLSSGATTLEFRTAPRDVTARTSSGSISIGVPPGQRYRVEGGSSFTKPDIAAGLQDDTSDRRIEVHTSSGSVKVRYAPH
ncbi:DUF4097 domain-containing protein [Actinoallomurus purpureus]|uniref:DUF4097 family beta strand repeat-containing protein n=1 Tax=Actinoallomurus purpureus TaxID=478114 RepID=UPI0020930E34|nr:DUF4097 family beta strand repeat-containing protein [Actinoallomurus purpureus]MCO6009292.1 DUF4097 domain-containing protein [Actinoallomurus purpureus]